MKENKIKKAAIAAVAGIVGILVFSTLSLLYPKVMLWDILGVASLALLFGAAALSILMQFFASLRDKRCKKPVKHLLLSAGLVSVMLFIVACSHFIGGVFGLDIATQFPSGKEIISILSWIPKLTFAYFLLSLLCWIIAEVTEWSPKQKG